MELTEEMIEQLKADLKTVKTYEDLMGKNGAIKKLIKTTLEQMLEAELTEHLGYEKYSPEGKNSGNSRNGKTYKTLKNDNGEIEIAVPRDRNGEFDPIIVKKYEKTIGPIEDKIISMYAKGMTTRDIQTHITELYGIDMSPTLISNITSKIIHLAEEWQNRPLEKKYPIVFFDAIHYKIRDESRKVISKAAYTCLAIDIEGKKDLLGLWVGEAEGANFWLNILTELKNRGVEDIFIACVDGLKGFPEAINSVFPKTEIQLCIIHQIRNTLKYIASKDQKQFIKELKEVYKAPTEEAALLNLEQLELNWGKKYSLAIRGWKTNWNNLATFFKYPEEIRTIIYTTNAVETLHRQFRKVTKSKSIFPNDDALKKMLFLAYRDLSKKWTMPIRNWAIVLSNFSIYFKDRFYEFD
ncbi:IS256 family transposase [Flavobacterium sp.]|uniref:IS256 family transposase n=1 Tax=Flavobacterium sp. TaxID=239 RepID=UPI002FDED400